MFPDVIKAGQWLGADNGAVRLVALADSHDGTVLACTHEEYDEAGAEWRTPVGVLWPLSRIAAATGPMVWSPGPRDGA
jgi:hypothetical protein